MKKYFALIILFVVCLIIGGIVYFSENRKKNLSQEKFEITQKLIPFSKDAIREIKINKIRFLRNSFTEKWTIVEPIQSAIDEERIVALLEKICALEYIEKQNISIEESLNLGITQDRELIVISVTGDYIIFNLSEQINNKNYFYDKIGAALYTVAASIDEIFNISLFDFRDKRIFEYSSAEINSLKLLRSDTDILEFEKVAKIGRADEWELIQPKKFRAEWLKVNNMLDNLLNAAAVDFIDADDTDILNLNFKDTIQINLSAQNTVKPFKSIITCWKTIISDSEYFLIKFLDNMTYYIVKPEIFENYYDGYLSFRNPRIFNETIQKTTVNSIQIKKADKHIELKKVGGSFISANEKLNQDTQAVDLLFQNLLLFKTKEFISDNAVDLFEYSLDKPYLQLLIESAGQKFNINFSKKKNDYYSCLITAEDVIIFKFESSAAREDIPEFIMPIIEYLQ